VNKPDIPPKPGVVAGQEGDGGSEVGRRVKRLQRQPAFREFDIVNAAATSTPLSHDSSDTNAPAAS